MTYWSVDITERNRYSTGVGLNYRLVDDLTSRAWNLSDAIKLGSSLGHRFVLCEIFVGCDSPRIAMISWFEIFSDIPPELNLI